MRSWPPEELEVMLQWGGSEPKPSVCQGCHSLLVMSDRGMFEHARICLQAAKN